LIKQFTLFAGGVMLFASCGAAKGKVAPALVPALPVKQIVKKVPTLNFGPVKTLDDASLKRLTEGTQVLLAAIDNYIELSPESKRTPEIFLLKGHTLYNNKLYPQARGAYKKVVDHFAKSIELPEAIKMTAQIFYEEKKFDQAKVWYQRLKESAVTGVDRKEAEVRLSEAYFQQGEKYRDEKKFDLAIDEFEKVASEFSKSKVADAALYNAGVLYEEKKSWTKAILTFNKLISTYPKSAHIEWSLFHTAKNYEELGNYPKAARTYVEIFNRFPHSKHVKGALYNAGVAYEKDENFILAAKAFEKYAKTWPDEKDAPDVLFKAGELYGKLEDWKSVQKVNRLFGQRYGKDKKRIVMALCMTGVAHFMQKEFDPAIREFERAIETAINLGLENPVNAFYGAKAQCTIGEIKQKKASRVALKMPETLYRQRLKEKIRLTEEAVKAFSRVGGFGLMEWTTRSIFRIGETFEQFGITMYKRERPQNLDFQKMLEYEASLASVVETYLAKKALEAHEKNVLLGVAEKYEDKWIKRSRQQMTKLPCLAADNYSLLVRAANVSESGPADKNPMVVIQQKLLTLQNVAPFQSKAIGLYLKVLEESAKHGIDDKYRRRAASEITRMSYRVGKTYSEVISVARGAPIPAAYDGYKKFFYRVNLLSEAIVTYEQDAISSLFKNVKIAEAYDIRDEWVDKSKALMSELLFNKGMCYEVLADIALREQPIPQDVTEEEAEEYKIQFEELGIRLQDVAYSVYRDVLAKGEDRITKGKYVNLSYLRLYQLFPEEFSIRVERDTAIVIATGKKWAVSEAPGEDWAGMKFTRAKWTRAKKGVKPDSVSLIGFSEKLTPVWGGKRIGKKYEQLQEVFLRRHFRLEKVPSKIEMEFAATGAYEIYCNGNLLLGDSLETDQAWFRRRFRENFSNILQKREKCDRGSCQTPWGARLRILYENGICGQVSYP